MSAALITALCSTVALFVVTAYFLLGSTALLVLEHDTSMDSRFVQKFLNTYCLAATFSAGATAVSYAFAGWFVVAAGASFLAASAVIMRRKVIPKMEVLRLQIQAGVAGAISKFRRIHLTVVLVAMGQLVLIVWSLVAVSLQTRAAT